MTSDEISFIFTAPYRDQVLCRYFTHSPIASCSHDGHALHKVEALSGPSLSSVREGWWEDDTT